MRAVSGVRSAKPVAVRDHCRNRACNSSDMPGWALVFQLGKKPLIAADRLIRSVARRVMGHMGKRRFVAAKLPPVEMDSKRVTNSVCSLPRCGGGLGRGVMQ